MCIGDENMLAMEIVNKHLFGVCFKSASCTECEGSIWQLCKPGLYAPVCVMYVILQRD